MKRKQAEKWIKNLKVVNKYTYKAEKNERVINIMRGSIWGNPYHMLNSSDRERDKVLQEYKSHIWSQFMLKGKTPIRVGLLSIMKALKREEKITLSCCCKPKNCHGDVIKSLIGWMLTVNSADRRHYNNVFDMNGDNLKRQPETIEV